MSSPKVAPRQAVDQLAAVLDSPEVGALIKTIGYIRTGRPGYSPRAMIGMCLVKTLYGLSTWTRAIRLVAEHEGLQRARAWLRPVAMGVLPLRQAVARP